jgi:N-acetyl-anhydromuramyl-L-alanine amidase AmpD
MAYPVPSITMIDFPSNQYYSEVVSKKQVYIHHTAGGPRASSVWNWWKNDKGRIATCVVIDHSGEIQQGFSSKFWAYHLGLANKHFGVMGLPYKNLDKLSIGIEICNWGQLTEKNGKFYNYVNGEVPLNQVTELETPYKNFKYFHSYTKEQIDSTKELLLLWNDRYGIPLTYNKDIWGLTPRAFKGESGVFTHNSVRTDKIDVYPHPDLVDMLKSIGL